VPRWRYALSQYFWFLLRPRKRLRSIVMSMSVYGFVGLCVCLSVCEDISETTYSIFTQFFVHVAYVRGLVLLQHVYDRPHRLSPRRGLIPHWKCIIGRERGYGSAQRGRSMLPPIALFFLFLFLRDTLSWLAHSFWVHVNIAHLIKTFGGRKLESLCHHLPQVTITYLAFSTEHWLVTDRSIDRQTDTMP